MGRQAEPGSAPFPGAMLDLARAVAYVIDGVLDLARAVAYVIDGVRRGPRRRRSQSEAISMKTIRFLSTTRIRAANAPTCAMLRISAFAAPMLFATLLSAPASAQNRYQDQVEAQVRDAAQSFIADGYRLTDSHTEQALKDGGSFELWLNLVGGVEYVILGVCDEDCGDLDLEVFSSEGASIDDDYEVDAFPIVALIPNASERFRVHVYMADCRVQPCAWGVGVFRR